MAKIISNVWVEKYRPKHVKDIVLPESFKKFFNDLIKEGNEVGIPNILLSSPTPGTGKTTIAKAIVADLNADAMYINASSENSIDVLRSQIAGFATTMSFNGGRKIVILDEADGLTPQFQKALRAFIEEFSSSCRFILTCNNIGKIIDPLKQGRTMVFDFDMGKQKDELIPKITARLEGILKHEDVPFEHDAVQRIAERTFPSIRKAISFCQQYAKIHGKIDEEAVPKNTDIDLVTTFIGGEKPNVTATRAFIENEGLYATEVFHALFTHFVPHEKCVKKAQATILLADYEYRSMISADPSLQIAACLIELAGCMK
jgi:DNA polymerase III gamma/tau subunit